MKNEGHPDPDELAAYHAGALPPAEEERVQDHLVLCRDCSEALLDLARLAEPESDDGEGLPAGLGDAVWQGIAPQLEKPKVVPFPARAPGDPGRRLQLFQALAAALFLTVLGLSLWNASLHRTVDALSRPQPDAPVIDLFSGTVRGDGSPRPVVTVAPDVPRFTVILNPMGQRSAAAYRAEVSRARDGAVVASAELRLNAYGSLSLGLARRSLGPGDFKIRLFARTAAGKETLAAEYALRVAGP
jgi:hypothetical protein